MGPAIAAIVTFVFQDKLRNPDMGARMKLHILTKYSRLGASSRLRTLQYLPMLQAEGFELHVAPLFDDAYIQNLYAGRRNPAQILGAYARRMSLAWATRTADLIWIEKEALPWVPWALEKQLFDKRTPIVTDYDDAIFHNYDLSRNALVRTLLSTKIDAVMKASALVMAGNPYLAARARRAGAVRVEQVPTVVDSDLYQPSTDTRHDRPLQIGWIGTPHTWARYGLPRMAFFSTLAKDEGVEFLLVGARMQPATEGAFTYIPWSEAEEISAIQQMNVGIMPLMDDPWERGKCGYKLIQYMACGLPVIASPVGVNVDIVSEGQTGFLADSDAAWRAAIRTLKSDPDRRRAMGRMGRQRVEQIYSLRAQGPRIAEFLKSLI